VEPRKPKVEELSKRWVAGEIQLREGNLGPIFNPVFKNSFIGVLRKLPPFQGLNFNLSQGPNLGDYQRGEVF